MLYIILAIEVLFYSLFIKLAKREVKFIGLLGTFTICTIEMMMLDGDKLIAYLLFFVLALIGMKFLGRSKVYNHDVLVLISMCIFKLILELIFTSLLHIFISDVYIVALMVDVVKIGTLILLRNKLKTFYIETTILWNNNNFYIRYLTSAIIMIYIIATCVLLVVQLI